MRCPFPLPLPRPARALAAAALLGGPLLLPAPCGAQALRDDLWAVDGQVYAVVATDTTVYLGGGFSRVGPATGGWARIDPTGAPMIPYSGVCGTVDTAVPDDAGGWYIGGSFTAVAGQPRANLARLDQWGNVTDWNPGADGEVYSLLRMGNTIYAAGGFTTVAGAGRSYLAAFDVTSGALTAWNPGADSPVFVLHAAGGLIYAGGSFATIGGAARHCLAQLGTDGSVGAWNPSPNSSVQAIASRPLSPGINLIYFSGVFNTVLGSPRQYLAAVTDAPLFELSSWNPAPNAPASAIVVSGSSIYLAGGFTNIAGATRHHVAELDFSGTPTAWAPDVNFGVLALGVSGGKIFIGGEFTQVGFDNRAHLAAIDPVTGTATSWNPSPTGPVHFLGFGGYDKVFAGGAFNIVGGVARNNLAQLDLRTGAATAWNPNAGNQVRAMVLSGNTLYVGGDFLNLGIYPRGHLGAVDATTGVPSTWDPGANNSVRCLLLWDTALFAGGYFTTLGGASRFCLGSVDTGTGLATPWNPGPNDAVYALGIYSTVTFPLTTIIYAGGQFTAVGGQPRYHVAGIDWYTATPTNWTPYVDGYVEALAISSGLRIPFTVYVAGCFWNAGGAARAHIAQLDVNGVATAWDPGADNCADVFGFGGGLLFAGGDFTSAGGQVRRSVAAIDRSTGAAVNWSADANGTVDALITRGGDLYMGGGFTAVAGFPHSGFAAVTQSVIAVDGPAPEFSAGGVRAAPNPSPSATAVALRFTLPVAGDVEVSVYDVAGRLVRRMAAGALAPGEQRLVWDGRDGEGSPTRAGLYFVRLRAGDLRLSTKVIRVE